MPIKKYITKKMIKEFLDKNFEVGGWRSTPESEVQEAYYSKLDGSYFTFVGLEEAVKKYLRLGITEQLQASQPSGKVVAIGFNPVEQKWYGWSHRAIYGFGVGSTCRRGDAHYIPSNKDDFLEDCKRFWKDWDHLNIEVEHGESSGCGGVWVRWIYSNTVKNRSLRGTISGVFTDYPDEYGKGEWVAETLEDAKQMACDYAREIS